MRLPARGSLRLRFLAGLLAWVGLGLLVVGLGASRLFHAHVEAQFHDELEVHLEELAALTRLDSEGRPVLERPLSDPRYAIPGSGFYWQVERHGRPPLRSPSLGPAGRLDTELAHQPEILHRLAPGPTGPTMTYGVMRKAGDGGPDLHFVIATDRRHLDSVVGAFDADLARWLGLLAVVLLGSALLLLAWTLKPLDRLAGAVARVRSGAARRVGADWPAEIRPLAAELDEALAASEARVARARLEAGNLAHGLRTSLAILADEAEDLMRGPAGASAAAVLGQCRTMARQLDWHLARARAGAPRGGQTEVGAAIVPIVAAMARLHGQRGVSFRLEPGPAAVAAIDTEDFAEIVSNLLDNAGKWARAEVTTTWALEGGAVAIAVTDDGPGIPPAAREGLFAPGARLDEQVPGHGLGLAIAQDLALRVGGAVSLDDRADGRSGLVARVTLPVAA